MVCVLVTPDKGTGHMFGWCYYKWSELICVSLGIYPHLCLNCVFICCGWKVQTLFYGIEPWTSVIMSPQSTTCHCMSGRIKVWPSSWEAGTFEEKKKKTSQTAKSDLWRVLLRGGFESCENLMILPTAKFLMRVWFITQTGFRPCSQRWAEPTFDVCEVSLL